jgi:hypothetical protein
MALRAREVAFLSGERTTAPLDGPCDGDASAHEARGSSSSSSSGFVALHRVVDLPAGEALSRQAPKGLDRSGFVLLTVAQASSQSLLRARVSLCVLGVLSTLGGNAASLNTRMPETAQVNLDLRPVAVPAAPALPEPAGGGAVAAGGSEDAPAAVASAAAARAAALREWLLGRSGHGALPWASGAPQPWCVVRVTLLHGDSPLAPPWVSSRVPLRLVDRGRSDSSASEAAAAAAGASGAPGPADGGGMSLDDGGLGAGGGDDRGALSATAVLEGPGSMAGGAGGLGTGGRVRWAGVRSRDLPRASRVLVEVLAVAPPPTRDRRATQAPAGPASRSSGRSSWWRRSSSGSSGSSSSSSSSIYAAGGRGGSNGGVGASGEESSKEGWPAVELKARFAVAAAWAAMERAEAASGETSASLDEEASDGQAALRLDKEGFKTLVNGWGAPVWAS